MTRNELLQALQEFDTEDLERALQAARASKLTRDEKLYFMHYFLEEQRVVDKEQAILTLPISDVIMNPLQIVHGGITAMLCDNAMGYASFLNKQRPGVTVNMNLTYHKPGRGKYLIAKADVLSSGSQLNTTQCEVRDEQGVLVASATGTFFHRKGVE